MVDETKDIPEGSNEEPELHSLSRPTPTPGQDPAKPVQGRKLTIRERVIENLKAKKENEAAKAAKDRLANATEKEKAVTFIALDDENTNEILTRGFESTRRTQASGGLGTLEDQINTAICAQIIQGHEISKEVMYREAKELIENHLPAGQTWNEETFYKIWNEIAALGRD